MHHLLTVMPVWLALVLFAAIPATIAVLLHDVFRRIVPADVLIPHHDVAGFLVSIVGLLFAVVLAFLVAAAWGDFDASQRNADSEASDVAETFATAAILPQPARSQIRSLLADYAFEVRDREWDLLAEGRPQDLRARDLMVRAYESITLSHIPRNATLAEALEQSSVQQILANNLESLSQDRRRRLLDAGRHIPAALYFALILGSLLLLAFIFLFGCTRALQLTMTALLTAMIGLLFGVIVEFDYPYSHGIRVSPEAWTLVIDNNHLDHFRTPSSAP
jgi:hypothetical protein